MCNQPFCPSTQIGPMRSPVPLSVGPAPSPDRELLLLRLRNAIADKEWATAAGTMESMNYDQWKSDWYKVIREADEEVAWVLHQLGGHDKGEG